MAEFTVEKYLFFGARRYAICEYAVLVDDQDIDFVQNKSWSVTSTYVVCSTPQFKGKPMHALICETPKGLVTHHINGNKFDNRRSNLVVMTMAEHSRIHSPHCFRGKPKDKPLDYDFMAIHGLRESLGSDWKDNLSDIKRCCDFMLNYHQCAPNQLSVEPEESNPTGYTRLHFRRILDNQMQDVSFICSQL